jgi:hypothetical protein
LCFRSRRLVLIRYNAPKILLLSFLILLTSIVTPGISGPGELLLATAAVGTEKS